MTAPVDHTRHSAIYLIPNSFRVGIIGAGGIGALTALTLAKVGVPYIFVWDDDYVGSENIATQFHRVSDIGMTKVSALAESVSAYSDCMVIPSTDRIHSDSILPDLDVLITAVDSLSARQDIWWAQGTHGFYIDARMGAMEYQHYVVDMRDMEAREKYAQELFALEDKDVADLPCTAKATIFTANFSAGYIGLEIARIVTGKAVSRRVVFNPSVDFLYTI